MKMLKFCQVALILLVIKTGAAYGSYHHLNPTPQFPNYVVIGAFASQDNAIKFSGHAKKMNFKAQYDINPNRNLYYVYVLTTENRTEAIQEALVVRKIKEFSDAWVYQGALGKSDVAQEEVATDTNPVTEQKIEPVTPSDNIVAETVKADTVVTQPENVLKPEIEKVALTTEDVQNKNFYFEVYRGVDNQILDGEVNVIDTDKSRKVGTYKGNTGVKVSLPASKSGAIMFECESFGYRKAQKEFNFKNPSDEKFSIDENGNIVFPFEMIRVQKGDIAVMYNVFFFKDAAIMRPESRYEVNTLLQMLKENPTKKIKIHGHTNGNSSGRIISMNEDKNFFDLTNSKDGFGSAKGLSEGRANCIREYLISNGIDGDRMLVKGWGGKKAIHDKHSARAQENVRVEIEILED
jgi:outer membrane protein OmpA-like peptidoglycan-associated protein